MPNNKGKEFESRFKEDWKRTFPDSFLFRLKDQITGFKETSQNPCDFFTHHNGKLYMVECKECKGTSINIASKIPQYERLLKYKNIDGVYPGVMIWFMRYDLVVWVPIKEMEKIVNDGHKSVSPNLINKKLYNILEIPSTKLRVFMQSDYTVMEDL